MVISNGKVFACRVSGRGASSGIRSLVPALPLGRLRRAVVADQFAGTARSRAQSRRAATFSFIVTESG
jgi:hypothetical protein